MSWLEGLAHEVGNRLLPYTAQKHVGAVAQRAYNTQGGIIYLIDNKILSPENQNTLLGFHLLDQLKKNDFLASSIIKGQAFTALFTLLLIGNETLDWEHVLKISKMIDECDPTCEGVGKSKTQVISIGFDTPALIDKYFKAYKETLIQKQTGLRIYEINYLIDVTTSF